MSKKKPPKRLKFKYVIPDHVKDCHVTGAWGGISKRGDIHLHFFNERPAIPNHIIVEVSDNDKIIQEVEKEAGGDFIRLIQASIVMDIPTAISIRNWMDNMIKTFEERFGKEINAIKDAQGGSDDEQTT